MDVRRGQPLADCEEPVAVEAHLHVVGVVGGLVVHRERDGTLGRLEQAAQHRGLEQRVAVHEDEVLRQLGGGHPAADQIVGQREERVVEGPDLVRPRAGAQETLDVVGREPDDHGHPVDPRARQLLELPLEDRAPADREGALGDAGGQRQQPPALACAQEESFHVSLARRLIIRQIVPIHERSLRRGGRQRYHHGRASRT
ncbi:MAG: hypothetical protein A3G44_17555 [Candidatus Rokubacteria bacterium RIFCSPLOWO2_12_FULL_73_47]|nr:MAG: hypothetical protein A3G44_17555 [Candidatus Rokubacteria bacterium RIFCSPLOWO2_12_FULL_73_47]